MTFTHSPQDNMLAAPVSIAHKVWNETDKAMLVRDVDNYEEFLQLYDTNSVWFTHDDPFERPDKFLFIRTPQDRHVIAPPS